MKRFNFVYCLAGKGKRFTDQNITLPKYLLKLDDGVTILEKSILEFDFPIGVNLHLVINKEHQVFVGQIEEILLKHDNKFKVIITGDTKGQAETAFIGCKSIGNDYPIFFFNGDTILKNRDIGHMCYDLGLNIAGAIDVFFEDRSHFSYVKLTQDGIVEKIAEKEVISNHATTGLYGFSSSELYIQYFNKLNIETEMYISDIYKLMVLNKEQIKGYVSPNQLDTIILGTPEEYISNKNKL